MTHLGQNKRAGNWPPNVDSGADNSYRQGGYDTGEVRDGHTVTRWDEDGEAYLEVDHPEACQEVIQDGDWQWIDHNCPWGRYAVECGPLVEQHRDGSEAAAALPEGKPVEVNYGWEGDGYFSWWVDA